MRAGSDTVGNFPQRLNVLNRKLNNERSSFAEPLIASHASSQPFAIAVDLNQLSQSI
jgi:hypothetical protein